MMRNMNSAPFGHEDDLVPLMGLFDDATILRMASLRLAIDSGEVSDEIPAEIKKLRWWMFLRLMKRKGKI